MRLVVIRNCAMIAAACGLVAGCGGSALETPTSPGSAGAFTGTWVPQVRVTSCTGSYECIAPPSWFLLRLVHEGSGVRGAAVIRGRVADVTGTIDPSGNVAFTALPGASLTVYELSIRADSTVGITGTIHYSTAGLTLRGEITSAKRGPLEQTLSTIQGTWFGDSLVRACTFAGYTECPRAARLFRVSLQQSGTVLSGDFDFSLDQRFRVPVRGTLTASVLTLTGEATITFPTGGTYRLRLMTWTSRPDALGRMNGTFTYDEESVQVDSRRTARYESDLTDTYLFPDWFSPPESAVRAAGTGSQGIFAALRPTSLTVPAENSISPY